MRLLFQVAEQDGVAVAAVFRYGATGKVRRNDLTLKAFYDEGTASEFNSLALSKWNSSSPLADWQVRARGEKGKINCTVRYTGKLVKKRI
jgi:hypothetical protein